MTRGAIMELFPVELLANSLNAKHSLFPNVIPFSCFRNSFISQYYLRILSKSVVSFLAAAVLVERPECRNVDGSSPAASIAATERHIFPQKVSEMTRN